MNKAFYWWCVLLVPCLTSVAQEGDPLPQSAGASCVTPPPGMVSWWRFENDVLDNWDSNNGTTPLGTLFTTGKVGRAFSASQRYVLVPDSPSLRFTNALTVEAWINPSTVSGSGFRTIVSKFDISGPVVSLSPGSQSSYYLGLTNGRVLFQLNSGGTPLPTNSTLVSIQTLPTNQWSHVVATFGNGTMRIFINGVEDAKRPHPGGIFPGTANLGIGAVAYGGPAPFSSLFIGLIDEVSIYSRELSEFEIQAIYNSDVAGKCLVPPTIISQPQSQSIPVNEDVLFSVSIVGTKPLKYQWRFNGQNLLNATNASLLLEKVGSNRIGNYSAFVTNSAGTALSSNAALTLLPPLMCVSPPPGMISWWPADGSGADAVDGNTALEGVFTNAGKVSQAFRFNGLPAYRILVQNSPSLNFGSNANFSVEGWIKAFLPNPAAVAYPNVPIIEKRTVSGASGVGYSLSLNQGRLAFWLGTNAINPISNNAMFISPEPDLRDGMFHHVALSLDRSSTNGGNLLVDGRIVLNFDARGFRSSLTNSSALFIGGPTTTVSNSYFNGVIDELTIYSRALSTNEIQAIYGAGSAGKCKDGPFIITQPVNLRVNLGSNATFAVTAGGTPNLRYQWMFNGTSISGATNASFTRTNAQLAHAGKYSALVSNGFGRVTSSNAVLIVNRAPLAASQSVTLDEDTALPVSLSASDPDGDALTFVLMTPPAHGSLSGATSNLFYTPNPNYFGPDSFTFKVNDGLADSLPAVVNITVRPVNDPPVAQSQSVSVNEDTPLAITLGAFDVEGDPLTFTVGTPTHGTLSGVAPNIVYLPNTNYFGPDSFVFKVNDGQLESAIATVGITVNAVNDAPVASMSVSPLVQFSGVTNLIAIAPDNVNATLVLDASQSSDVENDPLQYTWLEGTNILATGVTFTNEFPVGTHIFTLIVSDGTDTGTDLKTVEVIPPAEAPRFVIDAINNSALPRRSVQPLIASLNAAAASFDRGNSAAGANQLQSFQNKVRAQIAPSDPVLAQQLIEETQIILDALAGPSPFLPVKSEPVVSPAVARAPGRDRAVIFQVTRPPP